MPLILSVDLTEIALFRDADETSGHRDLIHIGVADEASATRRYSRWHRADRYWEVGFAPQFQDQMDGENARVHGRFVRINRTGVRIASARTKRCARGVSLCSAFYFCKSCGAVLWRNMAYKTGSKQIAAAAT